MTIDNDVNRGAIEAALREFDKACEELDLKKELLDSLKANPGNHLASNKLADEIEDLESQKQRALVEIFDAMRKYNGL